jgi:Acyl-CoA dehydrogenase, N-terminal domain
MQRTLYEADHEAYRNAVREFLGREVVPHKDRWDDQHMIDRD